MTNEVESNRYYLNYINSQMIKVYHNLNNVRTKSYIRHCNECGCDTNYNDSICEDCFDIIIRIKMEQVIKYLNKSYEKNPLNIIEPFLLGYYINVNNFSSRFYHKFLSFYYKKTKDIEIEFEDFDFEKKDIITKNILKKN